MGLGDNRGIIGRLKGLAIGILSIFFLVRLASTAQITVLLYETILC